MKKTDDFNNLDLAVQGNIVNMEILLLNELRDVDTSIGTPYYPDKVKILKRTLESYPKIKDDKEYWDEISKAVIFVKDKKAIIHNRRTAKNKHIEIKTIKETDWEAIDSILRCYLSKYGLTFKKETHDKL